MKIRGDIGVYNKPGYSESVIRFCKAICSAQVCGTKLKTRQTSLHVYAGLPGIVCEQQTTSHFMF